MSIFDKYDLLDVNEELEIPLKPESGITALIGSSGSGKTTILKDWGMVQPEYCEETPIYKLFNCEEDAEKYLLMFGLRTIPAWRRSLTQLSNGERQRAVFALNYSNDVLFCDEFTSLVDRDTALALCNSINKAKPENLIVASCHKDIADFLYCDQIYDCDKRKWRSLRPVGVHTKTLDFRQVETKEAWRIFGKHHYLSGKVNTSATTYAAFINGKPVAMCAFIAFPSGSFKNAWRGHRTIVLPEFQGMGIGNALSDWVARKISENGGRYFSKTAHPAMGEHRERSKKWRPTSKNKVIRNDYKSKRKTKEDGHKMKHAHRVCYSHEYIG